MKYIKMSMIFDVLKWKIKAVFSNKNHISSVVYDSAIHPTAAVRNHVRIYHSSLGKYSYVARNSLIQNAKIGSFCSISEGCNIGLPAHPVVFVSTSPVFLQGNNYLKYNYSRLTFDDSLETIIGNDVWIGSHAQIKGGVTIGNGAIVAAGAVVVADVLPYAIVGGVPAKILKFRFSTETREILNQLQWWNLSDFELKNFAGQFENPEKIMKVIRDFHREEKP